ncbi:hypothetical protein SARC_12360, partial [Sphaeroforma arctica JP610]
DVTVTVICTANTSNFYEVQTNADGTYVIDDVKDCDYTVSVPASFNGEPIEGSDVKPVSISPTVRAGVANFQYVPLGSISGHTCFSGTSTPVVNVTVTLRCIGEDQVSRTDDTGYYYFGDLVDCDYEVFVPTLVDQSDMIQVSLVQGPDDTDGTESSTIVTIDKDGTTESDPLNEEDVDFFYNLVPSPSPSASMSPSLSPSVSMSPSTTPSPTPSVLPPGCVTGRVTDLEDGGAGIPNFPVEVTCYLDETIVYQKQLTTDGLGEYNFPNVPEGYECEVSVDVNNVPVAVDVNLDDEDATCSRVE